MVAVAVGCWSDSGLGLGPAFVVAPDLGIVAAPGLAVGFAVAAAAAAAVETQDTGKSSV